jgi:hypothetical protein
MIEDTDQLTETFSAHEHLAPDAAEVLAKAHGIARSYQRRRWAVRATGGAVLGVGLVAGGVALPGVIGASSTGGSGGSSVLIPADDPSPTPTPAYTEQQELNAYFAADYDYNNAVALSNIWNDGKDIEGVKAEAGLLLLEGQTLPVTPSGPDSAPPVTPSGPVVTYSQKDINAYFAAGYNYQDALALGRLWHKTDTVGVKTEAGRKLLNGETLPIAP